MPLLPRLVVAHFFAFSLCFFSPLAFGDVPTVTSIPENLRAALMAGDSAQVSQLVEKLAASKPEDADLWKLLEAEAFRRADKLEEAITILVSIEEKFPDSKWLHKARFRRADLLRSLRRYGEAQKIYEEETQRLRSAQRLGELAEALLIHADTLSTPPENPAPGDPGVDYSRALQLYSEVLQLDPPRDRIDRAMARITLCYQRLKNHGAVLQAASQYIERFDPSEEGSEGMREGAGVHLFEVLLRRARAWRIIGNLAEARRAYEDFDPIASSALAGGEVWGDSFSDPEKIEELTELRGEALFEIEETWPLPNTAVTSTDLGIGALRRFLERFPQHRKAAEASFKIGSRFWGVGNAEKALSAWRNFIETVVEGESPEEMKRRTELRQSASFSIGEVLLAEDRIDEAIAAFQGYARDFPDGSQWADARRNVVAAEFRRGSLLLLEEKWSEARTALARFADQHPIDSRVPSTLEGIALSWADEAGALSGDKRLSQLEGEPKDRVASLYRKSISANQKLIDKYPQSFQASQARLRNGILYEEQFFDLIEAVEAYRSCIGTQSENVARTRLARMEEETLAISTERTWRSDEAPRITVDVRNIEKLKVLVYPLDLEAYFRKHIGREGIEDLDLDLIAADKTVEVEVDGYERYRAIRQQIEIPVEGQGTWAVAVLGEGQRATTLLIRSDIDLIVKSSRREVFIFTQNMKLGRAARGVDLLVAASDAEGEMSIREVKSGDDGIVKIGFDELAQGSTVKVFARKGKNVASEGLGLSGLTLAQTLQPKWSLLTDRASYLPAEMVRWRGVIREVEDGSYSIPEGETYQVEVLTPGGLVYLREERTVNEFGTLRGAFRLPDEEGLGRWTIRAQGTDVASHSGGFLVEMIVPRQLDLVLETDKKVYFRGEIVECVATATYYYGEPVAEAQLNATLPDGRVLSLTTDAKGRATFSYNTREQVSEGSITFYSQLPELGVVANASVRLAVQAFDLGIKTSRELYLEGDTIAVAFECNDTAGEPVARGLNLRVLKIAENTRGNKIEIPVSETPISTDESGKGATRITIEGGGEHWLVVEGTDRFGNLVASRSQVFISDSSDPVKLRWITDLDDLEVGAEVSIDLHSRMNSGLALITFEGEGVIDHRVVSIDEGTTAVTFDVGSEFYPSITISAAVMQKNQLHLSDIDFSISRQLKLKVTGPESPVETGESVTLNFEATDLLGNPVEAEIAIAVVDASVDDLHQDWFTPLARVFESKNRRDSGLHTSSSCTFSYQGVTRQIAEEVLLEEQEMLLEAMEKLVVGNPAEEMDDMRAFRRTRGRPTAPPAAALSLGFSSDGLQAQSEGNSYAISGGGGGAFGQRFGKGSMIRSGGAARMETGPSASGFTAYWNGALKTDSKGQADATFRLPQKSTRWRVRCQGVSTGDLFGGDSIEIVSRRDLDLQLVLPPEATEGDSIRPRVRILNGTGEKGAATVSVTIGAGDGAIVLSSEIILVEGVQEILLESTGGLQAHEALPLAARLKAQLPSGEREVTSVERLGVRRWGLEGEGRRGGLIEGEVETTLELPGEGAWSDRVLEIFVGASIDRVLVDLARRGPASFGPVQRHTGHLPNTHKAAELLGAVEVLSMIERTGSPIPVDEIRQIRSRAVRLIAEISGIQRNDGGWCWIGAKSGTQVPTSATIMIALGRAQGSGLQVPEHVIGRGTQFLEAAFRKSTQQEDDLKSMLIHALAETGGGDFSAANRLHRSRNQLSIPALAHLTQALVVMERTPMARDCAEELIGRRSGDGSWSNEKVDNWNRSNVYLNALALWAAESAGISASDLKPSADWLLARQPWGWSRGNGFAVAAIARFQGESVPSATDIEITWSVDGGPEKILVLESGIVSKRAIVALGEGSGLVKLNLTSSGRGQPRFSAHLRGFTRNVAPRKDPGFAIKDLSYLAIPPYFKGRPISSGFNVVTKESPRWSNDVSRLPQGDRTRVTIKISDERRRSPRRGVHEYLQVEMQLPPGTQMVSNSVTGPVESYEQRGNTLLAWVRAAGNWGLSYELVGSLPGEFRVLPPVVRSVLEPQRSSVGEVVEFKVLQRDEVSDDPYRETPDELYSRGQIAYAAGEWRQARDHLTRLYDEHQEFLHEPQLRTVATWLLFTSIDAGDSSSMVRFFEILREKDPELSVPFDKVILIGEAYRKLGEHQRALLVFKAVVEETFGKDLKVAGALKAQGDSSGFISTLDRLIVEYPDTSTVNNAWLTLADIALETAIVARTDKGLREKGLTPVSLTRIGVRQLQHFLALHGDDPLAADAGLNLVSAYLGTEDYETTARESKLLAEVYSSPREADAFRYTEAVARWYLDEEEKALELLENIAEATYTDAAGNSIPSENRDLALYILGQIHHARGEISDATSYYEQVEKLFSDARETLQAFRSREISIDEVTSVKPGDKVDLAIRYRNIEEAEVLVYAVDLMTLYLREKNLSGITSVNLAGINPAVRTTVALGEIGPGGGALPAETSVELDLDGVGAYLVICRGDDQHTSGLVLVSDLQLVVEEDPSSGRVRVQAMNRDQGEFLREVDIRVIGSNDSEFVSGRSDPRGIFTTGGITGTTTVIARRGEREYAFHRGVEFLGARILQEPQRVRQMLKKETDKAGQLEIGDYLNNVLEQNFMNREQRNSDWTNEVKKSREGVQIKQAN